MTQLIGNDMRNVDRQQPILTKRELRITLWSVFLFTGGYVLAKAFGVYA